MLEGYDFVRFGLIRDLFKRPSSRAVALYLWKRADFTGYGEEIHILEGEFPLTIHDLYIVLVQAEPEVWGAFCDWCEEGDERQARIDNALGKRY